MALGKYRYEYTKQQGDLGYRGQGANGFGSLNRVPSDERSTHQPVSAWPWLARIPRPPMCASIRVHNISTINSTNR